jgi:glucosamine--fructose-6-phosphate aminotransferase (isomerizing)
VTALALVAIHLARVRDMSPQVGRELVAAMAELPERIEEALELEAQIKMIAEHYAHRPSAFFIGRGIGYPIALEGAQKLKEISYIHAEAYPASELKHGPLALITPELPTVVALPKDLLFDKSIASIQEIKARRGPVIAVTNTRDERVDELADHVIVAPHTLDVLAPIVMGIPMQLLAYHAACHLGHDIDQPRNLAKSVTVE